MIVRNGNALKFEPLYLRVKTRLRQEWQDAQSGPNLERLPTLDELQARYRVSRPTISKALAALVAEGFLIKERGRGTFALASVEAQDAVAAGARLTVGFIAPLYAAELPQSAFRGIDRIAHRRGGRVLMAGAGDSVAREWAAAQEMIAGGARG
ncbi:MAG: GntR family transcriptional regulator, partial [Armatimonadota bacterium]|nr:GntR family transcriptional regulator [Armatimonadota bacterium]